MESMKDRSSSTEAEGGGGAEEVEWLRGGKTD